MIGLAPKPQDVYNNNNNTQKKSKIEWETKILFFTSNHSTIDVWRWIFVSKYEITKGNINLQKIKIKLWLNLNNLEQIYNDYWDKQSIKTSYQNNKW